MQIGRLGHVRYMRAMEFPAVVDYKTHTTMLDIEISYQGESSIDKAIQLDDAVIPEIIKAVNNHTSLIIALQECVALLEDPNAESHDVDKVLALVKATITKAQGD